MAANPVGNGSHRVPFSWCSTRFTKSSLNCEDVRRPTFHTHHVSFNELAPNWAKSPDFRTLYGSDLEKIDQRSFSVFFRANGWAAGPYGWSLGDGGQENADKVSYRRYFGFGSFAHDRTGKTRKEMTKIDARHHSRWPLCRPRGIRQCRGPPRQPAGRLYSRREAAVGRQHGPQHLTKSCSQDVRILTGFLRIAALPSVKKRAPHSRRRSRDRFKSR